MAAFHYLIRAKIIRYIKGNGEIKFSQFEHKFENENPIVARNLAFKHYQNHIDVLLEAKQKKYYSDRQAREELKSFFESGNKTKMQIGESEVEFSDVFGSGIGIFLIVDTPKPDSVYEDKEGEEIFIHGIGNLGLFYEDPDRLIFELHREYEYFTFFNYEISNKAIEVVYCSRDEWEEGYRENEPATYHIIETPFDWSGLDKPYWWGEQEDEQIEKTSEASVALEKIIQGGESNQVEFKPSLLYNFFTGKGGIGVKGIIAKAICAFLNSNGGLLIIGINDKGESKGLSFDFSLSEGKNEKDFFKLEFDEMLGRFLSFSVKSNVSAKFFRRNEKDIFVVTVTPSKRRPVFLKGQNGKEFYVRGEASSRQITDMEEVVNYCIEKWGCNDT